MPSLLRLLPLAAALISLTGCATYLTPGPKADLQAFAPAAIQDAFAVQPTRPFPASIALVRVQSPEYTNYNLRRHGGQHGSGRYSVVLSREVGEDNHVDRIASLPQVTGLVALNRMLLPSQLEGDQDIRGAAARLHADLVFIYTFDTTFIDENTAKPLSVITLGLSPTRRITAVTTASALLLDTRTGYVYSAYETTSRKTALATSWGSADSADAVRRETETTAFAKLVDEFTASWPALVAGEAPRNKSRDI